MKKMTIILCLILLLTGCVRAPQDTTTKPVITTPGPQPSGTTNPGTVTDTDSVGILEDIWALYEESDRFAVYGGAVEQAVSDAPGALDLTNSEEIISRYLLPEAQLEKVTEGASLVHMMNSNIFTAAVFTLSNGGDAEAVARAWRDAIHQNRWICGQPEKLLMCRIGDSILMAFGNGDAMTQFEAKTGESFPDGQKLYSEAIVG